MSSGYKVGDRVFFGRSRGERTLGEIVKLNPKRAKVKQLESRGTQKTHSVGTVWTVPYNLLSKADAKHSEAVQEKDPADEPIKVSLFQDPVEVHILEAICGIYTALSPENLSGDGERPRSEVDRLYRQYHTQLRHLFNALGRPVSEMVVYKWLDERMVNVKLTREWPSEHGQPIGGSHGSQRSASS